MNFLGFISLQDIILVGLLVWASQTYIHEITPNSGLVDLPYPIFYPIIRFIAWGVYGYVLGLVMLGLFHVGHECGHGAYSTSKTANTVVGCMVHSW